MYNANNKITSYIIKQEFFEESNDSGDISVSQSSRIFIMNNQYSRYSFTSNRKTSIIQNTGPFEGYYDFSVGDFSESTISASYDEDYSFNFYLSDEFIIPLHIKANNEINFTYPPINYNGAIDDFGFIEFDDNSIVTLLNSPHYRRGEYVEYTLEKDLYLINSIEDTYHQSPSVNFTYQDKINDAYLIGTMYDDGEISEYIQIDATTFGYKSTYFRYLDKNTSSFEMKWLFEQTPTYAGEVGVNIYFNYHEIFYNNYGKKDYHYILFEENPIFELLN